MEASLLLLHAVVDTQVTAPAWAVAIAAVVTVVGGAFLGFYARWKRTNLQLVSEEVKISIEGQKASGDLEKLRRDEVVEAYRKAAEEQKKRADEADSRAIRLIDAANKRTDEANARADQKDKEWSDRMENLATRYRERESLATKQHQERELQFQGIVDKLRTEHDAKIEAVASKHADCMKDNAEIRIENAALRSRMSEVEKRVEDLQARLDARDTRRTGGRRKDDPPHEEETT